MLRRARLMGTTCVLRDRLQSAGAIHVFAAPGGPGTWQGLFCGAKRLCTATVPLPLAFPNGAMPHPRKAGDSGGGNAVWIRRDNAHKHFRWETGPALLLTQVDLEVSSWSRENPDVEKSEPSCIVSGCETVQHCGEQPANPFTSYM